VTSAQLLSAASGCATGTQAAGPGDVVGARAAGKQAIVTDAVEARRQDVDQEAADELAG